MSGLWVPKRQVCLSEVIAVPAVRPSIAPLYNEGLRFFSQGCDDTPCPLVVEPESYLLTGIQRLQGGRVLVTVLVLCHLASLQPLVVSFGRILWAQ